MSDSARPHLVFPQPLIYRPLLERALREDLGRAGDLTSDAIAAASDQLQGRIVSRQAACLAGLPLLQATFDLLDGEVSVSPECEDGQQVSAGVVLARLTGSARAVLSGERTALNLLSRLSGIATATRAIADRLEGTGAAVVCTRKTTPGLRALEKYAVRAGGGSNHRFGLDDAVLIKDNHIALAGSVAEAIERVCRRVGHMVKIEVEVDNLDQLREALEQPIDAVLLDNMSVDHVTRAVELVGGRFLIEVSGGITADDAARLGRAGVDLISVGALTHSAAAADVSLEVDLQPTADS